MAQQYTVRNDPQRLKFTGELLAESSSRHRRSDRWVEFQLYKTQGGTYILSRIGQSLVFHGPICETLARSDHLVPGTPAQQGVPCEVCSPDRNDVVLPEQPRYWAQAMETPEAVLESLYRYDEYGARFLTHVARDLVERAAAKDKAISDAYYVEYVK